MTEISAIVVSWNTRPLLEKCLDALYEAGAGLDMDVWVVDNHSSDGSQALVREKYPQAHLIENDDNVGFSRANNQAAAQSDGDYLLLLNSDAFLSTGAIKRLLDVMLAYPDTGAAGSQLLNEDLSLQRSCFSFPTLATELWQTLWLDKAFPNSRVFGKYLMTYWPMDDFREVDVVMGACMLVRRQALKDEKLFDESFFMYSEEVDLCYRLRQDGWKVRYVPDAQAVHVWGGSARKVKVETLLRLYRSRVQFFRKHYGAVPATLYKGLLLVNSLTRWLSVGVISALSRNRNLLEKSQGYGQLFRNVHAF